MNEHTDPLCLSPTDADALLAGAPWRRFAAIGDSLSAGTGDPAPGYGTAPWPERVADALRRTNPDLAYLNTGVVGATTAQTLAAQADTMIGFAPDLLHVPCGADDIVRREPDWAGIEQQLRALHGLAAGTGALVTTFTLGRAFVVPAIPDFPDRVRRVDELTRAVAADLGALVIEMWDHPVNDRPELLSADGIHFSTVGQAVMAAEVVRGLAGVLAVRS